jgi:hypothetical protein
MSSGFVIPGGREQHKPVEEATDSTLEYWARNAREEGVKEACANELERRGMGGGTPPSDRANAAPTPPVATAQRAPAVSHAAALSVVDLSAITKGTDVSTKLAELQAQCHLVSPATASADLPEGFSLAISMVQINVKGGTQVVYPLAMTEINGVWEQMYGLARASIEQIVGAAGVSWDPQLCRRIDDGRDRRYCVFTAIGYARNLDGSVRTITGTKEMDLRDGSAQIEALQERAKKPKADGGARKDPSGQICEMRLHIMAHAETKAKGRAGRSLGIRSSYSVSELAKPFAVVRLAATGRTEDPVLRREFARLNYAAAVTGTAQLYGGAPRQHQLAAPAEARREIEYDDQTGEIF